MKWYKGSFIVCLLLVSIGSFGQNLIKNGNFETNERAPWNEFNNQILSDNLTNSLVGNINNGEGSFFQIVNLETNKTYKVVFDYRWVSGNGNYNMTVRAKDENSSTIFGELTLDTSVDVWKKGQFTFTVTTNISEVRLVFYKSTGNRPLRIDNVYLAEDMTTTNSFVDPETPINAQPVGAPGNWTLDFSDEFSGNTINTAKWIISESTKSRAPRENLGVTDWRWIKENATLNGTGELVLTAQKINSTTMRCGSIESRGIYETKYGFLEARIKIATTAKGNHTAFWLQGQNQGNVDNSAADGAEVDIFESAWVTNDTKAVVHFDGYNNATKKNHTIPYNTPNLHVGYHTFGLLWTKDKMDIYYDGNKVESKQASKPFPFTTDPNGYKLVPQVEEWLWLSVGASFGDGDFQSQPVGKLSDAFVDYVRVYKPTETLTVIDENVAKEKFLLYPNPVKNNLKIATKALNYLVTMYNSKGRKVLDIQKQYEGNIDTRNLAKGLYFIKISTKRESSIHKIVVE